MKGLRGTIPCTERKWETVASGVLRKIALRYTKPPYILLIIISLLLTHCSLIATISTTLILICR